MTTPTPEPKKTKPYPKYESHCHGAPVEVRDGKVKYYCTECNKKCIAVNKKPRND